LVLKHLLGCTTLIADIGVESFVNNLTWFVSYNQAAITVDNYGIVTGVTPTRADLPGALNIPAEVSVMLPTWGTPTIAIASVTVYPIASTSIEIARDNMTFDNYDIAQFEVGDTLNLEAIFTTITGLDPSRIDLYWAITVPNPVTPGNTVASINTSTGEFEALSPGTGTIVVLNWNWAGTTPPVTFDAIAFNIVAPPIVPVTGVNLPNQDFTFVVGQPRTLMHEIIPANATNQNVAWIGGSPDVIIVNPNGTITPVGPGIGVVAVITEDGSHIATHSIVVIPSQ